MFFSSTPCASLVNVYGLGFFSTVFWNLGLFSLFLCLEGFSFSTLIQCNHLFVWSSLWSSLWSPLWFPLLVFSLFVCSLLVFSLLVFSLLVFNLMLLPLLLPQLLLLQRPLLLLVLHFVHLTHHTHEFIRHLTQFRNLPCNPFVLFHR